MSEFSKKVTFRLPKNAPLLYEVKMPDKVKHTQHTDSHTCVAIVDVEEDPEISPVLIDWFKQLHVTSKK